MSSFGQPIPYIEAMAIAIWIGWQVEDLTIHGSVVGSLRRKKSMVNDIDILLEVASPIEENIKEIKARIGRKAVWYQGGDKMLSYSSVLDTQIPMQVWLVYPPRNFYAMLALRTGPAEDSIRLKEGLIANGFQRPHGEISVGSEQEFYQLAGLKWIEPTEREKSK